MIITKHGQAAPGPVPVGMRVFPTVAAWRRVPSWEWHRAGVGPEPVDELASQPLAGGEDDAVSPVAPVACRSRYGPEEQATRNRHIRIHHFVPDVGGTEHYNNAGQPTTEGRTMAPNITLLELVNEVATHAGSDAEVVATVVYLVNSGRVRLCGSFKGARFDLSPDIPRRAAA